MASGKWRAAASERAAASSEVSDAALCAARANASGERHSAPATASASARRKNGAIFVHAFAAAFEGGIFPDDVRRLFSQVVAGERSAPLSFLPFLPFLLDSEGSGDYNARVSATLA